MTQSGLLELPSIFCVVSAAGDCRSLAVVQHRKEPSPQALASLAVLFPTLKSKDGFPEAEVIPVRRRAGQEKARKLPAACGVRTTGTITVNYCDTRPGLSWPWILHLQPYLEGEPWRY